MLPLSRNYLTDRFEFRKAALIKFKAPWDFSDETSINGFEIAGTEPQGTCRRVIFEIDGKLFKFGSNGLIEYGGLGTLKDIIAQGNTVGELLEVASVPEFVGKRVYPIVALDAPADAPVFPKIKIAVKVQSFNDVYTCYRYSPVYPLAANAKVIDVTAEKWTRGYGVANVQCRLKTITGWGDWINLNDARFKAASEIQFRVQFILTALDGSDFAEVTSLTVRFSSDANLLCGDVQEIICQPQEYDADLGTCYALIHHSTLKDCSIEAFVKFQPALTRRVNVPVGNYLSFNGVVDTGILQDSIHLEGAAPIDSFFFDTENSSVKADADNLSATYDCGLIDETWREMELDFKTGNATRFIYRATDANLRVSAVKFRLKRLRGEVTETWDGNGKLQIAALTHFPDSISVDAPYFFNDRLFVLSRPAPVNLSYSFRGIFPLIHDYIIGWEVR